MTFGRTKPFHIVARFYKKQTGIGTDFNYYIYTIEIVAMCIYGFTGVLALKPERNDLINVILLGLISSTGGGAVRDVLLSCPVLSSFPDYAPYP